MPAPAAGNHRLIFDDGEPFALADTGSSSVSAGSAKPVAAISTLADYLINGFWQYNNTVAHHWASNTITYNIAGLNAAEQFLAQSAMQAWHDVANITFVRTAGSANITFSDAGAMQAVTNASWYSNGSMDSANVDISSDWIASDGGAMDGKTGIDSYGYQTYIHEIGHALGLGHQGAYNGSASYATNALYADDTWQFSIMSYFSQNNYSGSSYRYVVSPQMADIYAVATIYGAATTRVGDTVYGFNSNAGAAFSFTGYSQAPALTIYDSGGNDTLDCSGYSVVQTIDLHAGAFSSVGGLVKNIGIALSAAIENAIGGSGNDTLIANDNGCTLSGGAGNDTLIGGAGNDRLIGGAGVDTMTSGGGADTFVFASGDSSATSGQHDRITDFVTGTDHIDLSGIDAIVGTAGIDQFYFIGSTAFDGRAGELDYSYNNALGVTIVQGDTNGDRLADFAIDLVGNLALSLADFIGAYSTPVVIEVAGATTLAQLGSNYVVYANGTGPGPTLKYGGVTLVATSQAGLWAPIAAEKTSTGYDVIWKVTGADQYSGWIADNNGNYVSGLLGVVSGSDPTFEALETAFHQDLNGDGVIGAPSVTTTVIEAFGSTKLDLVGTSYSFDSVNGGTGPILKYAGSTIVAGQSNWAPIGVEQTSDGYIVAFKLAGADSYILWNTDSSGNFVSGVAEGQMSGSSAALKSYETTFHQDLNGDGVIGVSAAGGTTTVIEAFGSTKLDLVGMSYSFDPVSGGTGPILKYAGTTIVAGQSSWAPIGVEQTSGGYIVAFKLASADSYILWNTDSSGNFVSGTPHGQMSGSSAALKSYESTFHQDLNGDGVIGAATTVIEAFGSTKLDLVGTNYSFDPVSGGTGPMLKYAGATIVAGQSSWAPIGVEQTSGGYVVAFKLAGADSYILWNTDSSGNFVSGVAEGQMSGSSTALKSYESTFHQDLNGDGVIGATAQAVLSIASAGNDNFVFATNAGADVATGASSVQRPGPSHDALSGALQALSQATGIDQQGIVGNHDIPAGMPDWIDHHAGNFMIV